MEEITARVNGERWRFDNGPEILGVSILDCRTVATLVDPDREEKPIAVRVSCDEGEIVKGLEYRFYGTWHSHPKYGPQFHAKTFVKSTPLKREGVIKYLQQCRYIGPAIASHIWKEFGASSVEMLRNNPLLVAETIGGPLTAERAQMAADYLCSVTATEQTNIELLDILGGQGFPHRLHREIIRRFGVRSAEIVRRNPYMLMQFRGCGFLRCDQLYLKLGGSPGKLKRQALCAWYTISSDSNGHVWYSPQHVRDGITTMVSGAEVRAVKAVELAVRAGLITPWRDERGTLWLAMAKDASVEDFLAEFVADHLRVPSEWPRVASSDMADDQQISLTRALTGAIGILSGGPGVGKTYVAARLIKAILNQYGKNCLAVVCPTGKAAVRITELMGNYGVNVRASTIHSLLGVRRPDEGEGWLFEHGPGNPLKKKFIVVDEASMVDASLLASLFRACAHDTHILLIGDTGQLPPVGRGAPLRDLIEAGVPCGHMTHIHRNCGRIVRACHETRAGGSFRASDRINISQGENLKFLSCGSQSLGLERVVESLRKIRDAGLSHPVWDCQVICAVNKNSKLSREAINKRLQNELNESGHSVRGNPFRVNDKVVCLRNGMVVAFEGAPSDFNTQKTDNGKVFVANGEQGRVMDIDPRTAVIQLESPNRMVNVYSSGASSDGNEGSFRDWDLAYALSAHKCQGSEFDVVFIMLDDSYGARMVCDRSWLYTAISRAKFACFLVGRHEVAYEMVRREAVTIRKTFLAERILENGRSEFAICSAGGRT